MRVTELIIVMIYFIFLVVLGLITQKKVSSSDSGIEEYYAAGKRIGPVVNSIALLSAAGSGGTFMASVGTTWELGLPYITSFGIGCSVGFMLAGLLVAKPLRNSGKITISEFLIDRYEGSVFLKVLIPVIIIIGSGMYLMSQMKAGGLVTSYITGWPYEWGLVIIALVFIFYVSLGGMLAVTWTNVLQGGLTLLLTLAIIVAGIAHLPMKWPDFIAHAAEINPTLGTFGESFSVLTYIGAFVTWAAAISVTPHLIMRIFTSDNAESAKLTLNYTTLVYAFVVIAPAYTVVPHVSNLGQSVMENYSSDMWMLLIAEKFFGPVMMGIIVAAILAAIMSTTDSLLLALSSAVAYDLYSGVMNPKAGKEKILKVSVILTWVIGIAVMLLSINPPAFLMVFYTAALGLMVSAFFAPLLLGIWWKEANTSGAIAGMLSGAISFLVAFTLFELPQNSEILISLPLSFIIMYVVSLRTKKNSEHVLEKMNGYHRNAHS